jgi:CRP-like cAMP-binding protein
MASTAAQVAFHSGWRIHAPHLELGEPQFERWQAKTSLSELSARVMREFDSLMFVDDYDAGEILFMEQEPLTRVFIVISGDVRLLMEDASGRRLAFQIAGQGTVLGMDSVLFGSPSKDRRHRARGVSSVCRTAS